MSLLWSELSVVWEECQQCDNQASGANMQKEAGGNKQKQVTAVTKMYSTLTLGVWRVEERD